MKLHRPKTEVQPLPPRFTRNVIIANSFFSVFILVLIMVLFGQLAQFSEYLAGRGDQRNAERDAQTQVICDLLSVMSDEQQREFVQKDGYQNLPCELNPAAGGGSTAPVPLPETASPSASDPSAPSSMMPPSTGTALPTGAIVPTPAAPGSASSAPGSTGSQEAGVTAPPASTTAPVAPVTPAPVTPRPSTAPPQPVPGGGGGGGAGGGLVPGVDVDLCLPLLGCLNV